MILDPKTQTTELIYTFGGNFLCWLRWWPTVRKKPRQTRNFITGVESASAITDSVADAFYLQTTKAPKSMRCHENIDQQFFFPSFFWKHSEIVAGFCVHLRREMRFYKQDGTTRKMNSYVKSGHPPDILRCSCNASCKRLSSTADKLSSTSGNRKIWLMKLRAANVMQGILQQACWQEKSIPLQMFTWLQQHTSLVKNEMSIQANRAIN